MAKEYPEVSVVIPVRDRTESVIRSVESVARQTYPIKEIIVVDDGSIEPIDADAFGDLQNVIVLRNVKPMGAPFSRNFGWRSATADMIGFLDSDDEMLPGCIEKKVAKAVQAGLDLVVGSFALEDGGRMTPYRFKADEDAALADQVLDNTRFDARTSTFLVRRSVLEQTAFDENLKKHQDWDLFINIARLHKVGFTNDCDVILHISSNDRISSHLKHDSTQYFIEKNSQKVSPDAMFLFMLKMLYKSVIRADQTGIELYRKMVIVPAAGVAIRYKMIALLIRFNLLNVSFLQFLKNIIRR